MPESFLHLSSIEQSQILRGLASRLSRPPTILEKDVWVCWVLQTLFTMPDRLPMAFKGCPFRVLIQRAASLIARAEEKCLLAVRGST